MANEVRREFFLPLTILFIYFFSPLFNQVFRDYSYKMILLKKNWNEKKNMRGKFNSDVSSSSLQD